MEGGLTGTCMLLKLKCDQCILLVHLKLLKIEEYFKKSLLINILICNVCYYSVICENLVMNKRKTIFVRNKGIINSKFFLIFIPILLYIPFIPCNHANTSPCYCLPCSLSCENLVVNQYISHEQGHSLY